MPEVPPLVAAAVTGTYARWRPYAAVTRPEPEPVDPEVAARLAAIDALSARIEAARRNPIFPPEEA